MTEHHETPFTVKDKETLAVTSDRYNTLYNDFKEHIGSTNKQFQHIYEKLELHEERTYSALEELRKAINSINTCLKVLIAVLVVSGAVRGYELLGTMVGG
jgi:archaellum component FlaC